MFPRGAVWTSCTAVFVLAGACGTSDAGGGPGAPDASVLDASASDGLAAADALDERAADTGRDDDTGAADGAPPDGGTAPCAPAPTSAAVVNVKDQGAKGDGTTDDTAAIQAAVAQIAGTGGTVLVPAGIFLIDALKGVQLKSKMTLRLAAGATLRAAPNDQTNYEVVAIRSATDVNVVGGTIEGERGAHTGTTGEWGHGINVDASQRVVLDHVTIKECWGDGIYVGGAATADVTVCGVVSDHNRRQGMSATSIDGLVVRDSSFQNTAGTEPEAGLDIEPNLGETVTNVSITRCTFRNNAGGGLQIGPAIADMATTFVTKTVVEDNVFTANGVGALSPPSYGIQLSACTGNTLRNNRVTGNAGIGIGVLYTTNALVTGNAVTGTTVAGAGEESGAGVILENDTGTGCTGNTVTGNAGHGIFLYQSNASVSGNTVSGNGKTP
jgi:parallel beta-helix repeat protein